MSDSYHILNELQYAVDGYKCLSWWDWWWRTDAEAQANAKLNKALIVAVIHVYTGGVDSSYQGMLERWVKYAHRYSSLWVW